MRTFIQSKVMDQVDSTSADDKAKGLTVLLYVEDEVQVTPSLKNKTFIKIKGKEKVPKLGDEYLLEVQVFTIAAVMGKPQTYYRLLAIHKKVNRLYSRHFQIHKSC
jgi:hypothetical protein